MEQQTSIWGFCLHFIFHAFFFHQLLLAASQSLYPELRKLTLKRYMCVPSFFFFFSGLVFIPCLKNNRQKPSKNKSVVNCSSMLSSTWCDSWGCPAPGSKWVPSNSEYSHCVKCRTRPAYIHLFAHQSKAALGRTILVKLLGRAFPERGAAVLQPSDGRPPAAKGAAVKRRGTAISPPVRGAPAANAAGCGAAACAAPRSAHSPFRATPVLCTDAHPAPQVTRQRPGGPCALASLRGTRGCKATSFSCGVAGGAGDLGGRDTRYPGTGQGHSPAGAGGCQPPSCLRTGTRNQDGAQALSAGLALPRPERK